MLCCAVLLYVMDGRRVLLHRDELYVLEPVDHRPLHPREEPLHPREGLGLLQVS